MTSSSLRLVGGVFAGAIIGSLLGTAGLSFALLDNDQGSSTVLSGGLVVPYDGYIVLNSTPLDSSAQPMRFQLYDTPTGGSPVWSETQSVSVYNGRFSVGIGKGTKDAGITRTFDEVILDAEKLFLSIEIEDASGTYVALSGRQALEAAPYAAWAGQGADFDVKGTLTVSEGAAVAGGLSVSGDTLISNGSDNNGSNAAHKLSNSGSTMLLNSNEIDSTDALYLQNNTKNLTRVEGQLRVAQAATLLAGASVTGSVDVTSNVNVGQTLTALAVNADAYRPPYRNWDTYGTGAGGAAIYNDSSGYKALMVVGNNSETGSSRKIELYDNVQVNGDLEVNGTITGIRLVHTSCSTSYTSCSSNGRGQANQLDYLDRHDMVCGNNRFLKGVLLESCAGDAVRYQYQCCNMALADN